MMPDWAFGADWNAWRLDGRSVVADTANGSMSDFDALPAAVEGAQGEQQCADDHFGNSADDVFQI
jgi:hypothetical protein